MAGKKLNRIQIISLLIGFLVLVIPLIIGYINHNKFKKKLTENSIIVPGKITGFDKTYKRADALNYIFEYNGKTYTTYSSSSGNPSDYEDMKLFVFNRTFPVLINKNNPKKYSKLLVVPEDFQEFGLEFPDSLKWILKYIDR